LHSRPEVTPRKYKRNKHQKNNALFRSTFAEKEDASERGSSNRTEPGWANRTFVSNG